MNLLRIQKHISLFQFSVLVLLLFSLNKNASGQLQFLNSEYDTNYICSYTEEFTGRTFSALSSVGLSFQDQKVDKTLDYGIHSKVAVGLGFNYSVVGLNLSFSPWGNSVASNNKYGKTKSLDIRMNLYGRKVIFDLYLMSHTGFYLSNPESILSNWEDKEAYPLRPDIKMFSAGIISQYLFNNKKFSLRATYLQNEWQKKSAGSFIVGASFFYSHFHGDSSFVPSQVNPPDFIYGYRFNHSSSYSLGINGGYIHTFVVKKHLFATLGLSIGPQISYASTSCTDSDQPKYNAFRIGFNGGIRAGIGYNSRRLFVGMFFISENLSHKLSIDDVSSSMTAGIFKVNVAYRFTLKKPIKILNPNYWKFLQPSQSEE